MTENYKSVFDIIGPVMIGPSSSHTAGAVAIGRAANGVFSESPSEIMIHYYESFAETHRGHGTDYAIISGILGFEPDDKRVPDAVKIAESRGIKITFIEEKGDSPIGHPNTAIIDLKNSSNEVTVSGCSIGGGTIEIRGIRMDGFDIKPKGSLPILFIEGGSQANIDMSNQVKKLTTINAQSVYISEQNYEISEYDLETNLKPNEISDLRKSGKRMIYI